MFYLTLSKVVQVLLEGTRSSLGLNSLERLPLSIVD